MICSSVDVMLRYDVNVYADDCMTYASYLDDKKACDVHTSENVTDTAALKESQPFVPSTTSTRR